ncbi:bromodomain associated protein [Ophiocordyceps camponoti-floridani]|uniref:Transcription initiation factor TFIID subunit 8 n=1 Tax=Ophiocordyceps camponoti-floridani TaxID=2030778 RepID=A0A8H4VFK9_9HYPO|nr:bromodomain associated protein [Ophiocordyceps camponoti-floridani]
MPSKRSLSPEDGSLESAFKRPRANTLPREAPNDSFDEALDEPDRALVSLSSTHRHHARLGLQRSIALVLNHDGFSSATPEAMESFTSLIECYMESLIEETKRFALSARRELPIPTDFGLMLRYHNLSTASLRPHLKHPLSRRPQLAPTYKTVTTADADALRTLPLLSPELSGEDDKKTKQYIPASFPDFPSRHTYRYTPQTETGGRDPKKIREEAARTAQQGEEALRRLVRASKMRKQKEAKTLVERDNHGRERFRLWESTMRRFMGSDGRGENAGQVETADHSMIVNGDAVFSRKDASRLGKRSGAMPVKGG